MAGKNEILFANLESADKSYLLDPLLNVEQDVGIPEMNESPQTLPIKKLRPFKNHPFRVDQESDDFLQLVDSIKENGIIYPILVRPLGDSYEIVAGHRRTLAGEKAGLEEVPVTIRVMDDYEATVIMVHTNMYRPQILISEKAKAYRMIMEQEKHQGKKGSDTAKMIGKENDSRRQVYRYIRLSYLSDAFLKMVDEGRLPIGIGTEIGYLDTNSQDALHAYMDKTGKKPNADQVAKLRKIYEEEGKSLSLERIIAELMDLVSKKPLTKVSFKTKELAGFFDKGTDAEVMTNTILMLLSKYRNGDFDSVLGAGLVKEVPKP